MFDQDHRTPSSLNARVGALALGVGAPLNLILHMQGAALGPLSFAIWLAVTFGVLNFCDEMGPGKPLNRAGLVLFAAAFCAQATALMSVDPSVLARAHLLYAFAVMGALVMWSVALLHRTSTARIVGAVGSALSVGAVVLLVAAHLALGAITVLGFSDLFVTLETAGRASSSRLVVIDGLLCLWSWSAAALLWSGGLRSVQAA